MHCECEYIIQGIYVFNIIEYWSMFDGVVHSLLCAVCMAWNRCNIPIVHFYNNYMTMILYCNVVCFLCLFSFISSRWPTRPFENGANIAIASMHSFCNIFSHYYRIMCIQTGIHLWNRYKERNKQNKCPIETVLLMATKKCRRKRRRRR